MSGEYGKCRVRQNNGYNIVSLNYGAVTGAAIDPVEKKPLYNYMPGCNVFSFGCYGCNFRCLNCQNYNISDPEIFDLKKIISFEDNLVSPNIIIENALKYKCEAIAYTYSEPTVFWEYCEDIIKSAKQKAPEIKHILVTNGFFSTELLNDIIENQYIDAMNIDLKFMDSNYDKICGGKVKPVLHNIKKIVQNSRIHLEITNLIIPELNSDINKIRELCKFVYELSPEIPMHFSKFFPMYKMGNYASTDENILLLAKSTAEEIGLKFVYIGNTGLKNVSDTICPKCNSLMIHRHNYQTQILGIKEENYINCKECNYKLKIK